MTQLAKKLWFSFKMASPTKKLKNSRFRSCKLRCRKRNYPKNFLFQKLPGRNNPCGSRACSPLVAQYLLSWRLNYALVWTKFSPNSQNNFPPNSQNNFPPNSLNHPRNYVQLDDFVPVDTFLRSGKSTQVTQKRSEAPERSQFERNQLFDSLKRYRSHKS